MSNQKDNMRKLISKDLKFNHDGTKVFVVDISRDKDNNFLKVALIDKHRKVEFLDNKLSQQQIDAINHFATTSDPTLVLSQEKVFVTRPVMKIH